MQLFQPTRTPTPTPVVSTNLPFAGVEIFRRYRFTDDSFIHSILQVLKSENNLLRHLSRHISPKRVVVVSLALAIIVYKHHGPSSFR